MCTSTFCVHQCAISQECSKAEPQSWFYALIPEVEQQAGKLLYSCPRSIRYHIVGPDLEGSNLLFLFNFNFVISFSTQFMHYPCVEWECRDLTGSNCPSGGRPGCFTILGPLTPYGIARLLVMGLLFQLATCTYASTQDRNFPSGDSPLGKKEGGIFWNFHSSLMTLASVPLGTLKNRGKINDFCLQRGLGPV